MRVKKAIGIRWTWSKTAVRRSRISPSPILADSHRVSRPRPASATAITAISSASCQTMLNGLPVDDSVDDLAGQHRCGHREDGGDHAEHEEPGQHSAPRPGEGEDPA